MASSLEIPKFATDAEEADWWSDNQPLVEANLRDAMMEGRAGHGTLMRRALESDAMIQLDVEDAQRARTAAERRGMRFDAYIKMLVHDALDRETEAA